MTEELQEAPEPMPGFSPNAMPCQIHLTSGKEFIVDDISAWGYVEQGIFATGHFKGRSGELDVLISDGQVEYIVLDFKRLKKFMDAQDKGIETATATALREIRESPST